LLAAETFGGLNTKRKIIHMATGMAANIAKMAAVVRRGFNFATNDGTADLPVNKRNHAVQDSKAPESGNQGAKAARILAIDADNSEDKRPSWQISA
jgi:hypothetical protein